MDNQKRSSTFIQKLRYIINNQPQYISWEQDQIHFTIFNVKAFESYILSKYFRHSRFTSFNRQLNMYNFHKKRTTSTNSFTFSNESFTKWSERDEYIERKNICKKRKQYECFSETTKQKSQEEDQQIAQQNFNSQKQQLNLPLSELINELVEQVTSQEFLLDQDVRNRIYQMLLKQKYKTINNKKILKFIYQCVGIDQNNKNQIDLEQFQNWPQMLFQSPTTLLQFIL